MPRGREKKFTVAQMREALDESKGMIYLAAARLGCVKSTVHSYINMYPELKDCVDSYRGKLVDIAESKLYEKVCEGDWNAIRFVLDRLGKDRGYGEAVKVDMDVHDEREQVRDELAEMLKQTGDRLRSRGYSGNGSHAVTE